MLSRILAFLLALALVLSLLGFRGGSQTGGDPLGILGLYAEYECPPLRYLLKYEPGRHLYYSDVPTVILLAKYYDTPFYKSIVDKWGNDMRRKKMDPMDPKWVNSYLSYYNHEVLLKSYDYRFHYNFSFHVVGYEAGFYDVILRLKVSVVSLKNFSHKIYESPVIEEHVRVSVEDRSVYYKGRYAGVWPFFLLPHELYEGSKVKLSDMILFKIFNVTNPVADHVEAELKAVVIPKDNEFLKSLWENFNRYFREVVGINVRPESTLEALQREAIEDPVLVNETEWASLKVTLEFYKSLGFSAPWITTLGKRNLILFGFDFNYDVNTGVAFWFDFNTLTAPDIFTYVIPLFALQEYYFGTPPCGAWILTSLSRKPYSGVTATEGVTATTPVTLTTVPATVSQPTGAGTATITTPVTPTVTWVATTPVTTTPTVPVKTGTPTITGVGVTGVQVTTPQVSAQPTGFEGLRPTRGFTSLEVVIFTLVVASLAIMVLALLRVLRRRL